MAHANIFQRVNKKVQKTSPREDSYDDTTLETIKVLGEQVLSLREIIEEQHHVIEDLASTVSNMKVSQKETNQNLNLAYIDQKDLAKQLRILRSNLQANQFGQNKPRSQAAPQQKEDQEIEELFFNNAKQSPVMKNAQASDAIKKTLEELKKLEKPKQRFLAKKAAEEQNQAQARTMQTRPTQTRAMQARPAQARPAIKRPDEVRTAQPSKRFANEELAKKILFGKTSKLLK